MPKRIDLVGKKFGRLTVISFAHGGNNAHWNCLCDCGKEKIVHSGCLKVGSTKSCGCLNSELAKKSVKKANAAFIEKMKANKVAKLASPEYIRAQEEIKQKRELRYHGLIKHKLYQVWRSMKRRCYEPERKDYKNYGALGVTVCSRWMMFKNFYDDMLEIGYQEGLTIDRINPYGNYEPGNVRWSTWKEQAKNKRKAWEYADVTVQA